MMMWFGPVTEAARGGHSSPAFDLIVGFGVLALAWVGYLKKEERQKISIWIAIGISAICAVFIYAGIRELVRMYGPFSVISSWINACIP
jgi:hypothetical protein